MWKVWRFLTWWLDAKKTPKGLFQWKQSRFSIALAAKYAQQGQQALKYINDVQVQGQRGADVVVFTTVHDSLEVIEHIGAKHTNGCNRNGHHACRGAHEDVDGTPDDDSDSSYKQPFAHP